MSPSIQAPKKRVFFFSHPRTASNLLVKLLSEQEGWSYGQYNFLTAFQYAIRNLDPEDESTLSEENMKEYFDMMAKGKENVESFLETADEEETHTFAKDHALMVLRPEPLLDIMGVQKTPPQMTTLSPPTNPTVFSDAQMSTFLPLISIRHPALVFESYLKVQGHFNLASALWSLGPTSLAAQRSIYGWYTTHTSTTPIIVDADDIIEQPEAITEKLCELTGMDASVVKTEWAVMPEETKKGLPLDKQIFLSTIIDSSGLMKSKSSRGLDLGKKMEEWKGLWGEEMAVYCMERVEKAMPDYEFLRGLKIV